MAFPDVDVLGPFGILDGEAEPFTRTAQFGFDDALLIRSPVAAFIFFQDADPL